MIFIVLPSPADDYSARLEQRLLNQQLCFFALDRRGWPRTWISLLSVAFSLEIQKGGNFLGNHREWLFLPSAEKGGKPRLHLIRGKSALKKSGRRKRRTCPSPSPLSQEHKGRGGGGGGLLSTLFSYYEKELASKWKISLRARANRTKWCFFLNCLCLSWLFVLIAWWISHTAITDVLGFFFFPLPLISFFWMPPPPAYPPRLPPFLFFPWLFLVGNWGSSLSESQTRFYTSETAMQTSKYIFRILVFEEKNQRKLKHLPVMPI